MKDEQVKILYVNGGLMDRGGVSSVMMSYFQHFDKSKVHIDFLVHGTGSGERDEEIIQAGSKIFSVPPKSKNPIVNKKMIKTVMMNEKYDIVHSHADSGNGYILKIAKKCGVDIRISHSHNTNYTISNKVRIALNEIQKKLINHYATHKWACSKKAAEWLYGTCDGVDIVNNAIDTKRFVYSLANRNEIRSRYGIKKNMSLEW